MNTYHVLNAINSAQVKKLTNEAYKYISESIIRILFRDIKTMLLNGLTEKFGGISQDLGSKVRVAALALPLVFGGMAANAQDQVATAPNGLAVKASTGHETTAPKGKSVTLRIGPGLSENAKDEVTLAARDIERNGCTAIITTERGFPGHVTVEVGDKSHKFRSIGSAGGTALDWCLDRI